MNEREALKLALEALEGQCRLVSQTRHRLVGPAITAIKEALSSCQCQECKVVLHASDCAVHSEPAYPKGQCNCGAQPEPWEKFCDSNCVWTDHHPDCKLAQQEPVAWMDDYNACKCPDNEARCFSDKVFRMMQKHTDSLVKRQEPVAKVCHDLDGHIGWNPNLKQLPNEGTPLYTTLPQRKPLTDEEIDEISKKHIAEGTRSFEVFARAIEEAHSIKGEA